MNVSRMCVKLKMMEMKMKNIFITMSEMEVIHKNEVSMLAFQPGLRIIFSPQTNGVHQYAEICLSMT